MSQVTIQCAWCQRVLSEGPAGGLVSHGICLSCAAEMNGTPIEDVYHLSAERRNRLPFGLIQLHGDGRVAQYNHAEAALSGLEPADVVGKNFFTEIAPCTAVREFAGTLEAMRAAQESGRREIDFLFRFPGRKVLARVVMIYNSHEDQCVLMVRARSSESS